MTNEEKCKKGIEACEKFFEEAEITTLRRMYGQIKYHEKEIKKINKDIENYKTGTAAYLVEYDKDGLIKHKFI